jgi:hypothetical protein
LVYVPCIALLELHCIGTSSSRGKSSWQLVATMSCFDAIGKLETSCKHVSGHMRGLQIRSALATELDLIKYRAVWRTEMTLERVTCSCVVVSIGVDINCR